MAEGPTNSSWSSLCSWARGQGYIGSIGPGAPATIQGFRIQLECLHQCLGQHRAFSVLRAYPAKSEAMGREREGQASCSLENLVFF